MLEAHPGIRSLGLGQDAVWSKEMRLKQPPQRSSLWILIFRDSANQVESETREPSSMGSMPREHIDESEGYNIDDRQQGEDVQSELIAVVPSMNYALG